MEREGSLKWWEDGCIGRLRTRLTQDDFPIVEGGISLDVDVVSAPCFEGPVIWEKHLALIKGHLAYSYWAICGIGQGRFLDRSSPYIWVVRSVPFG